MNDQKHAELGAASHRRRRPKYLRLPFTKWLSGHILPWSASTKPWTLRKNSQPRIGQIRHGILVRSKGTSSVRLGGEVKSPGWSLISIYTPIFPTALHAEEIVRPAQRCGFKAIALTDHDTVEGCDRMARACRSADIKVHSRAELTVDMNGMSARARLLFGYGKPILLTELARFQECASNAFEKWFERINGLGIPLRVDRGIFPRTCRSRDPPGPRVGAG